MDRLEKVRKYAEEHPEIDQKKAPNLVTYTRGTNKTYGKYVKIHELKSGRIFYNIYKGFDFREWGWPYDYLDIQAMSAQNGINRWGLYMNYVDELQMLELGAVIIDISRANDKLNIDKRLWRLCGNRYFIFNDDKTAYCEHEGSVCEYGTIGRYYNHDIFDMFIELGRSSYISTKGQFEEFNAFINGTREKNTNPKINWGWGLHEAYRKLYRKDTLKEEKELFDKTNKELKNINDFDLPSATFKIEKNPYSGNITVEFEKTMEQVIYDKNSNNDDVFRTCGVKTLFCLKEDYVGIKGKVKSLNSYKTTANIGKSFKILCDYSEVQRIIVKNEITIDGYDSNRNHYYRSYGKTTSDEVKQKYLNDLYNENSDYQFRTVFNTKDMVRNFSIINLDDMLKEPKFKAHETDIRALDSCNKLSIAALYNLGCFS